MALRRLKLISVNLVTFSRLVAGISTVFVYQNAPDYRSLLAIFAFILVSDILDGALARRWRVTTSAGAIFDYVVDRFNSYLQVSILVAAGVGVWVFLPFFLRDLFYIFVQSYIKLDRVVGTKSLSFISTVATYLCVLWHAAGYSNDRYLDVGLFASYFFSIGNLIWRIYKLRREIAEKIQDDIST